MPRGKQAAKKSAPKKETTRSIGKIHVEVDSNSSIGVRKIENGYLVSESGTTGTGRNTKYYEKQYYSPVNPIKIATNGKVKFGGKR